MLHLTLKKLPERKFVSKFLSAGCVRKICLPYELSQNKKKLKHTRLAQSQLPCHPARLHLPAVSRRKRKGGPDVTLVMREVTPQVFRNFQLN